MKDFDSLIYILITIVAFAISVLGRKKKKNTPRVNPVNNTEPVQKKEKPFFANLEQLLNEELGINDQNLTNQFEEKAETHEEPKIVEKVEEPLDTVPPEMLDDKEDVPYSIEYEDTSEIFSKSIKDGDLVEDEEISLIPDFNLKDAIIYSEILNRKEY